MPKTFSTILLCGALAASGLALARAADPSPAPTATQRPLPEIYHTSARPLCSALHNKVAPSVGMILQNDEQISKGLTYFKDYSRAATSGSEGGKSLATMRMENVVGPIADNIIAIEKLLNDPAVFPNTAANEDDRKKQELKDQLLQTIAKQQGSLDIINGFVETQNLANMQHEGFGEIQSIISPDEIHQQNGASQNSMMSTNFATPDPLHPATFDDTAIQAGLPQNPYEMDLTKLPGLSLGFNPLSALQKGVVETQDQNKAAEERLAKTVQATVRLCGGQPTP